MKLVYPGLGQFFPEDKLDALAEVIESPEMDSKFFAILADYCYEDQDFAAYQDGMADVMAEIAVVADAELKMDADGIKSMLVALKQDMYIICQMMPPKPLVMCNATQAEMLSACPFYTPDIMDVWMMGVDPEAAVFADLGAVCMSENCTMAIAESGCYDMEAVVTPVMGLCGCHAKLVEVDGNCGNVLVETAAAFTGAVEAVTLNLATGSYDETSPAAMTLKSAAEICPAADGSKSTCMEAMHQIQECAVLDEALLHPAMNGVCCLLGVTEEPKCGELLGSFAAMSTWNLQDWDAMVSLEVLNDANTSVEDKAKVVEDARFDTYGKLMIGVYTSKCDLFDLDALEMCGPKMGCLDSMSNPDDHSGRRLQAGHMGGPDDDDMSGPRITDGIEPRIERMKMLCDPEYCGTKILTECLKMPWESRIKMADMEGGMSMSGRKLLEHTLPPGGARPQPPALLLQVLNPLMEVVAMEANSTDAEMFKEMGKKIMAGMCRQECYDVITSCKDEPDLFALGDNSKVEATCAEVRFPKAPHLLLVLLPLFSLLRVRKYSHR